jgi:molybdopterin-guanine dinucleotide biosynthesis protein A
LSPAFDPKQAMGFVLAGGQSSRMGQDKALVRLGGLTFVERAVSTLRAAGLVVAVAGTQSVLDVDVPAIHDASPDQGPLSGICTALSQTNAEWSVFLPVDMPFVPPSLLDSMLRSAMSTDREVTLVSMSGFRQTFPAVLNRAVLPSLTNSLQSGTRGCFRAFEAAAARLGGRMALLPVEMLAVAGQVADREGSPAARWLVNINTPADLEDAGSFLSGRFA